MLPAHYGRVLLATGGEAVSGFGTHHYRISLTRRACPARSRCIRRRDGWQEHPRRNRLPCSSRTGDRNEPAASRWACLHAVRPACYDLSQTSGCATAFLLPGWNTHA
jgi:hypothetical protein